MMANPCTICDVKRRWSSSWLCTRNERKFIYKVGPSQKLFVRNCSVYYKTCAGQHGMNDPRLTSERYLVLPTNVSNDRFYNDLRQACRALIDFADPDYYNSGIAVTKNFVASPHIDQGSKLSIRSDTGKLYGVWKDNVLLMVVTLSSMLWIRTIASQNLTDMGRRGPVQPHFLRYMRSKQEWW